MPEVTRYLCEHRLTSYDRPDILCHIFQIKLDQLLNDIKHDQMFGKVKAGMINNFFFPYQ